MKTTVNEFAIRQLIKERLTPVDPNPVVDPSAAVTNPQNPNFRPESVAEFQVGLNSHLEDLPVQKLRSSYEEIVGVLTKKKSKKEDNKMKSKKMSVAEAAIRKHVRKIIAEAKEDAPDHRSKENIKRAQDTLRRFGTEGDYEGITSADTVAGVDAMSKLNIAADDAKSFGMGGDLGGVLDSRLDGSWKKIYGYQKYNEKAFVTKTSDEQAISALRALLATENIDSSDYDYLSTVLDGIDKSSFSQTEKSEIRDAVKKAIYAHVKSAE
jgi:hypothetical protein